MHWTLPLALLLVAPQASAPEESEADLIARARRIHYDALTLDTHKDIRATLARTSAAEDPAERERERRRDDPTLWGPNQVDFPKMRAGGLDVAFYIVYVGQGALDEAGFARARAQALAKFDAIERMAERYPGHIGLARSAADVERITSEGRLVACIGIENGYAMGEDLGAIAEFHARGARYMSITHNRHSQLGDSNIPEEPIHGGLSDLGRRAIEEMNRVGIMVDVSHAAKTTTLQTIEHSVAPCIASHSSVSGVFEHSRNLDDETLKALAARGRLVVLDPRRTETAKLAGEHHFIRPGSDALLLAAMLSVIVSEGLVAPGRLASLTDGLDEALAAVAGFTPESVADRTGVPAEVTRELARALATRPAVLLLDEPFAGVDPINVHEIQLLVHQLREQGIGILITDHNVRETLQSTDRAYIIHQGHILREGTSDELVSDPEVRRVYLGSNFDVSLNKVTHQEEAGLFEG